VVVCVAVVYAFGNTRYRTPAEITITVLAAVAIDAGISRWRQRGEHEAADEETPVADGVDVGQPVAVGAPTDASEPGPADGHDDTA
jgi:hypothetical protein